MRYYVIENRNIGVRGKPEMVETVKYVTENRLEAAKYESELRKTYKDRIIVDCFVRSEEELEKEKKFREIYDNLTDEQKKDFIEVDGRKYIRCLYELRKGNQ